MYCSQCGRMIAGNARYCPGCGARQEMGIVSAEEKMSEGASDQEKERRKAHRRGRRFGNFLVSVIALLILVAGEKEVPDAADYTLQRMAASRFTVQNQREMAICDEQGTVCTIDIPQNILYSGDHGQMAYVDQDGELYYMEDRTPVFIDDAVTEAQWSFYGDSVIYVKEEGSGRNILCAYETESGSSESTTVADCREYAVSSDGKTAACLDADETLYLWRLGRQVSEISRNVSEILALADDGESILYRKGEDRLFLYMKEEEREVASIGTELCFMLNESQTEILYTDQGNTWYYTSELEEPVRLTGVKGEVLTSCCYMADAAYQQRRGLILGRKTLKDMTFAVSDPKDRSYKLYHLDRKGEKAEAVLNHADQFQISENGKSLLYLSGQKLYYIKNTSDSQDKICLSGILEVSQFAADSRLGKIWFAASDHELYYIKNKECINLSGNLSRMQGICMDGLLFQEDRDLYFADGEEIYLLKEDVDDVSIQENDYVVIDTDYELCYLKDADQTISLMSSR